MSDETMKKNLEVEEIKPLGMVDGIMKDETHHDVTNQRVSLDPTTKNDILQEEHEKKPELETDSKQPEVSDTMVEPEMKRPEKTPEVDEIKPGGMVDGIMKDETHYGVTNQRVSQDPATENDILQEEHEKKI